MRWLPSSRPREKGTPGVCLAQNGVPYGSAGQPPEDSGWVRLIAA